MAFGESGLIRGMAFGESGLTGVSKFFIIGGTS
jgi:hypothetical protein